MTRSSSRPRGVRQGGRQRSQLGQLLAAAPHRPPHPGVVQRRDADHQHVTADRRGVPARVAGDPAGVHPAADRGAHPEEVPLGSARRRSPRPAGRPGRWPAGSRPTTRRTYSEGGVSRVPSANRQRASYPSWASSPPTSTRPSGRCAGVPAIGSTQRGSASSACTCVSPVRGSTASTRPCCCERRSTVISGPPLGPAHRDQVRVGLPVPVHVDPAVVEVEQVQADLGVRATGPGVRDGRRRARRLGRVVQVPAVQPGLVHPGGQHRCGRPAPTSSRGTGRTPRPRCARPAPRSPRRPRRRAGCRCRRRRPPAARPGERPRPRR